MGSRAGIVGFWARSDLRASFNTHGLEWFPWLTMPSGRQGLLEDSLRLQDLITHLQVEAVSLDAKGIRPDSKQRASCSTGPGLGSGQEGAA